MFYCEKCRLENDWPGGILDDPTSFGNCEMCKGRGRQPCYDIPSSHLPNPTPKQKTRPRGASAINIQSVLKGSYDMLRKSAEVHRSIDYNSVAAQCDLQADAVLKYIDDETDLPTRKETSDD